MASWKAIAIFLVMFGAVSVVISAKSLWTGNVSGHHETPTFSTSTEQKQLSPPKEPSDRTTLLSLPSLVVTSATSSASVSTLATSRSPVSASVGSSASRSLSPVSYTPSMSKQPSPSRSSALCLDAATSSNVRVQGDMTRITATALAKQQASAQFGGAVYADAIIFATCTSGNIAMADNWLLVLLKYAPATAQRVLIASHDLECVEFLLGFNAEHRCNIPTYLAPVSGANTTLQSAYNTNYFNVFCWEKLAHGHEIQKLGTTLLVIDVDFYLFRDPFPYLPPEPRGRLPVMMDGGSCEVDANGKPLKEINGGFQLLRPDQTEWVAEWLKNRSMDGRYHDQAGLARALPRILAKQLAAWTCLPKDMYFMGTGWDKIYPNFQNFGGIHNQGVFTADDKYQVMLRYGFWFSSRKLPAQKQKPRV